MILLLFKLSIIAYVFCALGADNMIFGWYQRLLLKLPDWLAFPLGACHKCFVGQVCTWGYLISYFKDYNFLNHLFFVASGIFLSVIYNFIWSKCEEE